MSEPTEPKKAEIVTETPVLKAKEKPKCQHCGRDLPNAGAKKMHEKACEKNPNKQPNKSKAAKPEVSGGGGALTPKKSGDNKPWWDRDII